MQNQRVKRIILDCDPGVDDALAIILALKSDAIELDSVTTVHGNVNVEQTTENALKILEFMGRKDIPVAKGAAKPWVVEPVNSKYIFGEDGLGNIASTLLCSSKAINIDAVTQILQRVKTGDIDAIVATGPLTNIANAFKKEEKLMNSVKEIIVMGGAIYVKGNITEFAEFNFYCDPHAADYVLKNSTNVTLIPLDVTTKVQLYESDIQLLKESVIKDFIQTITKTWFSFSKSIKQDGIALHDPLAVGLAIFKDFVNTQKISLKVNLEEDKRGRCEVVLKNENNSSFIKYGERVGNKNFKEFFINSLNK